MAKSNSEESKKAPSTKNTGNKLKSFSHDLWKGVQKADGETIIYVLLAVGLVLLLIQPFFGGILVGLVVGYLFANEILTGVVKVKNLIEEEPVGRGVALGAVLLAFFISAPAIVIGALVSVALRRLLVK